MKKRISLLVVLVVLTGLFGACKPRESEPSTSPSAAIPSVVPASVTPSQAPEQSTEPQDPESAETVTAASVQESIFQKDYAIKGNGGTLKGSLYISVPKISSDEYPDNAAMINDYFAKQQAKYQEGFEAELSDSADSEQLYGDEAARTLDYTFRTEYNSGTVISFYITINSYSGGAHDMTVIDSETFDLSKGARITASELFSVDEAVYTKTIKAFILKEMDRHAKEPESPYFENYAELVEATYNKDSFVLTEDGLRVYFQLYDVAPFAGGSIQFVIPYADIADILNPQYDIH